MKNNVLYELTFERKIEFINGEWIFDSNVIGYFLTRKRAEEISQRYKMRIVGFKEYDGEFRIKKRRVISYSKTEAPIYVLWHSYFIEDEDCDCETVFGLYRSMYSARKALSKYMRKKPFSDYPYDFNIDEICVNLLGWQYGFDLI